MSEIPLQLDEVCCFFLVMVFFGAIADWFTSQRSISRRR